MKRILVTGGLGFIGSNLIDGIIPKYNVTVLDDLSSGRIRNVSQHLNNPNFRLVKGSVLDQHAIVEAIQDVEVVVHLAAVVSVIRSIKEPRLVHQVNTEGTLNILETCAKHSVGKVIFISSAAVYGNDSAPPFSEDLSLKPLSLYGATKEAGEAYVKAYSETHGLKTVILRLMNVYGPRRSPGLYSGVMMRFAEAISLRKPLTVYGDGEQTRDFTFVSDITDAIMRAFELERAVGHTFNVGTGIPSTINKLAALFLKMGGSKSPILHEAARRGEIRASYADIRKARKFLGYKPQISLEKGAESFMHWYNTEQMRRVEKSMIE